MILVHKFKKVSDIEGSELLQVEKNVWMEMLSKSVEAVNGKYKIRVSDGTLLEFDESETVEVLKIEQREIFNPDNYTWR